MGGMHFGRMLPIQPGMGVIPPPPPLPPIPAQLEEEATPRSPPRGIASYPKADQEYEHPSSSDDGVQVEAEESRLEEVHHEDLEDEYGVKAIEEERLGTPHPLPPLPRSTHPPIPTGRPPPLPPIGQRPRSKRRLPLGEADPLKQSCRPRDPHPIRERQVLPWLRSSVPQSLEPSDLAATRQWEQPLILSWSLDLHDSGDLSGSR